MSDVVYIPRTEDQEMGKVREIFDRALNALVDATSLAKVVDTLKTDLESLKTQVTHYRNTIANQDDQITRLRQDRDAARTAQYQAEDNTRHMTTKVETLGRENDSLNAANIRMNERVHELTVERDEAQYKLLELQEAHKSLAEKLDKVKALFAVLEPSKPEPIPEPEPLPAPTVESNVAQLEPVPEWQAPTNPPEPSPPETWPHEIAR